MRTPSSSLAAREGFTLVEVLVAMTVLLIGVLGTLALIDRANATTVTTRSREAAVNVARELVEAARSVPFAKLTQTAVEGEIQAQPGLADDGEPAGWTIRRRGFTYTVSATVCTFDDARDNGGSHATGGFCADSAATSATPDKNPEDYRRVRVEVRWTERGNARTVHQTVLINNPGSAGAPAVRTLVIPGSVLVDPNTNHVWDTAAAGNVIPFNLTTSSAPATLHWLLDGTSQAPITSGAGLAWNFGWDVGAEGAPGSVVDGTYVVSAEAFDTYGVSGPARSLTVTLNRSEPSRVEGLVGGRTGDPASPADQTVDLEWLPNPERDIIGYSVYRTDAAGNVVEVCPREPVTTCRDTDPPVEDGLEYRVQAWDLDHLNGQPRPAIELSTPLVVDLGNNPPLPPVAPQAQLQADGSIQLSWTRPSPEDPDIGDSIAFFRIYRDGAGYDSRYATWSGTEFNDGDTGGTAHEYWIASVDSRYGESAPVKAVGP